MTFSLGLPTFLSHGHKRWWGEGKGERIHGDGREGSGEREDGKEAVRGRLARSWEMCWWGEGGEERKGGEGEGNERIKEKVEGGREEAGGRGWWGEGVG